MRLPGIFIFILFTFILQHCSDKNVKEKPETKPVQKIIFANLVFVGTTDKPELFKFDLEDKSIKPIWSHKKEKVVELSYSPDRKILFFLTAKKWGISGNIPSINDVKLYMINTETFKVDFIEKIGTGIQVFSQWENESSFKVTLNYVDKTISSYINQNTRLFNSFGKKLSDEIKTFDLTKDGYPRLEKSTNFNSGKFILEESAKDSIVYIKDIEEEERFQITKTKQNINRIEWLHEISAIIFSTLDAALTEESVNEDSIETSGLYFYSINEKKIKEKWAGKGYKNFDVINNYLIFDTGFDENSIIILFDLLKEETIDTIKIKGGCGLRNIPKLPGL